MASLYIRICHTHTHAEPVGPCRKAIPQCCGRKLCHGALRLQAVAHHGRESGVAAIAGLI
jgi:hypothetical protein